MVRCGYRCSSFVQLCHRIAGQASSVCLALVVPKQADDAVIAAWLRRVSRAFAATEGVNEDTMHSILESQNLAVGIRLQDDPFILLRLVVAPDIGQHVLF